MPESIEIAGKDSGRNVDELPRLLLMLTYARSGRRWAAEQLAQDALASNRTPAESPAATQRRALELSASTVVTLTAAFRSRCKLAGRRGLVPAELSADAEQYWQAVRDLPANQCDAVLLRDAAGLNPNEIAAVLQVDVDAAALLLANGRAGLARHFDPSAAIEVELVAE